MWHDLISEISALGWRAFLYGPEAWLVLPVFLVVIGAAFLAIITGSTSRK